LTGLPSLSSQYSGIGLQATVKVFAKTADILVLQVQEPKYIDVNNVLHPSENGADTSYKTEGWNWRKLNLPPLKQVNYSCVVFLFVNNITRIFLFYYYLWEYATLSKNISSQVPAEYEQILAKPVEFVIACDGAVREVIVSKEEPEWSINFKKALIVQFQTKVDSYSVELQQNRVCIYSNSCYVLFILKTILSSY
jgi:hypothetical protein